MFAHLSLNEGQLSCNKERYCIPERPITFFRVNSRICLPIGDPNTHYINFLDVPIHCGKQPIKFSSVGHA